MLDLTPEARRAEIEASIAACDARIAVLEQRIRRSKIGMALAAAGPACVFVGQTTGMLWLVAASFIPTGISIWVAVSLAQQR